MIKRIARWFYNLGHCAVVIFDGPYTVLHTERWGSTDPEAWASKLIDDSEIRRYAEGEITVIYCGFRFGRIWELYSKEMTVER